MKFKNQEAYVYGDTQLIYFSDIRECIKNQQEIELILLNVESENNKISKGSNNNSYHLNDDHMFPPIVNTLHIERSIEEEISLRKIRKQTLPNKKNIS